ncbi:MAG: hypothetical protein ACRD3I_06545, partial [Terriglobales bacterium]
QFKQAVDRAYQGKACSAFAEHLSGATRHGRGTGTFGTNCSPGQFWDPNGSCYSCPKGYTRTLNPVEGRGACVDRFAGELERSACSVFAAADQVFAGSAKCSVEILESGVFLDRQMNFALASREVCMSTGEFVYSVVDLTSRPPQEKTRKLNSDLQALLAKVKNSPAYQRGRIVLGTVGTAASGADVGSKLKKLPHCQ